MTHVHFATVAPEDYPKLRRLLPLETPDTFDRWQEGLRQRRDLHDTRGHTCQQVRIRPEAFELYCLERGIGKPGLTDLNNYAFRLNSPPQPRRSC